MVTDMKNYRRCVLVVVAILVCVRFTFAFLTDFIYVAWEASGVPIPPHMDATTVVEGLAWTFSLAVIACAVATSLRLLYPILGKLGIAVAVLVSVVLLGLYLWDFTYSHLIVDGWWLPAIWAVALGSLIGAVLVGPRQGVKFLWIPVLQVLLAVITLWLGVRPALQFMASN